MSLLAADKALVTDVVSKIQSTNFRLPLSVAIDSSLQNVNDKARRVYLRNLLYREVPKKLKQVAKLKHSKSIYRDAFKNQAFHKYRSQP